MGKTYSIRKVGGGGGDQADLWKKKMSVGLFSTFRHPLIGRWENCLNKDRTACWYMEALVNLGQARSISPWTKGIMCRNPEVVCGLVLDIFKHWWRALKDHRHTSWQYCTILINSAGHVTRYMPAEIFEFGTWGKWPLHTFIFSRFLRFSCYF